LGGKLRYACDPCPLWQDSASRPPPLQHRAPIRAAGQLDFSSLPASVSLVRIAPGPFLSQAEPSWEQARTLGLTTALFQPHGILDSRMGLSTSFLRCRSAAASSGLLATPVSFRLTQSPLGASLQPQALIPVGRLSVAGGPFDSFGGLSVGQLAPVPKSRFHPRGTQSFGMSLSGLLTIANALPPPATDSVCPQPLLLPVEQNPLAAYRLTRFPRQRPTRLNLCEEESPLPTFAFDLAVLSLHGPHCSPWPGFHRVKAFRREQSRRVLWIARYP